MARPRGYEPLFEVIDGLAAVKFTNVWPNKLEIFPWMVNKLCLMSEAKELSKERRKDLAESLAVLVDLVPRPFAEKARAGLASLEDGDPKEAINVRLARKSPDSLEAQLAQIDALARENLEYAFGAVIELGLEIRWADGRNLADAIPAFQKALELARRLGNNIQEATAHYNLGIVQTLCQQTDDAESHFREAVSLTAELGSNWIVAESYYELGAIFETREDIAQAEGYYRLAISVGQEINSRSAALHSYQNLANMKLNQGAVEIAGAFVDKASNILSSVILTDRDRVLEEARNLLLRARIEAALGNLDSARQMLPEPEEIPETNLREAVTNFQQVLGIMRS